MGYKSVLDIIPSKIHFFTIPILRKGSLLGDIWMFWDNSKFLWHPIPLMAIGFLWRHCCIVTSQKNPVSFSLRKIGNFKQELALLVWVKHNALYHDIGSIMEGVQALMLALLAFLAFDISPNPCCVCDVISLFPNPLIWSLT